MVRLARGATMLVGALLRARAVDGGLADGASSAGFGVLTSKPRIGLLLRHVG